MPRRGDIAVCAHGYIGLITCETPDIVVHPGGGVGVELWKGIHLTTKGGRIIGALWQSRCPKVIGNVDDLASITSIFNKVERNPPEPGNLFPPAYIRKGGPPLEARFPAQPYESQRFAADGFFEGDTEYNGD